MFHALNIPTGVVIADKRHDSLRKAHGNLHGDHIDFLSDSHSCHGISSECGSEIVEHSHSRYIQEILDGCRDSYTKYALHNRGAKAKHAGSDTDICISSSEEEQNEKIQACHTI